jgi:hypothetical protein
MSKVSLEQRIAALEADVALLKGTTKNSADPEPTWLDKAYGAFASDPTYDEAMRLGREYRKATTPKSRTSRTR